MVRCANFVHHERVVSGVSLYRDYESTEAFTAGVIGLPGARTFFLQIGDAGDLLTIKCEKEQISALAVFLRKTLEDAPAVSPGSLRNSPFVEPDDAAFALGSVGLAYDRRDDHLILQFEEISPEDDPEFDASRVRVRITRAQAVAFCEHADRLVRAGRPPCAFCGLPMNRDGHACPKMN